jgi:hypothetical protein
MAIEWRGASRFLNTKSGKVTAKAIIYEREGGFGMEVHSSRSDSVTKIAHWTAEGLGSPVLYYVYDIVPHANAPQGTDAYTGAAVLHYYPDDDQLRGNYWTSQMTVGEFKLTRQSENEVAIGEQLKKTPERKGTGMRWASFMMLAALAVAVIWFLLVRPAAETAQTAAEREIEFAVTQASKTCLMNLDDREQRSIETGVRKKLNDAGAGGFTTIERTRKSVNEAFTEAGQIEQGRQLRDCMAAQTDKFLNEAKNRDRPKAPLQSGGPDAAAVGENATESGPATGYIYYEEDSGALTQDGVFGPLNGPAPSYGALHRNQILRSVRAAQLRAKPSSGAPLVKMLEAGQCVQIMSEPSQPQAGLTRATSGGRVNVRAISCPASG